MSAGNIHAAVEGVEQALREVGSCAEELDLLARLRRGNAAADAVVVAPDRTHDAVVFVLDGAGIDGNFGRVFLEGLGQSGRPEHRQVRLGSGSHVLEGMEEAVVVLGDHMSAVHADARHFEGDPDGIAREQLVIGRDARKLDHAELEHEVIDQLLRLALGEGALVKVALDVDIEEGRDSADAHRRAVLGLDRGEVTEVEPLNGFLGVLRGLGNIIAVDLRHLLHALEGADLLGDLLSETDMLVAHVSAAAVEQILFLDENQIIQTVERDAAVVADDPASAVGVGQSRDDVAVTRTLHLGGIGVKNRLIVRLVVIGENLAAFMLSSM